MKISVILATYNEAENIEELLSEIKSSLDDNNFEIIVVDDDSPDRTWEIASASAQYDPKKVIVIRRIGERGLVSAINKGIKESKGDVVCWLDADFSHPPSLLPQMVKEIKNNDLVIASRYVGGKDNRDFIRVIGSYLTTLFASIFLGFDVRDYTSGYFMAKKEIFDGIELRGIYADYCINFVWDVKKKKHRIKEVPYVSVERAKGISKTSPNPLVFVRYGLLCIFTVLKLRIKGK